MSINDRTILPAGNFDIEASAFLESLDASPAWALTACAQWRVHEVTAHLAAGAVEIAINLEAYAEGRPVPETRGFEERETPYRAMEDATLRSELPRALDRLTRALVTVLAVEPDASVPWTGRQMAVKSFVTHLRSELAIHRWDLVGDDEVSWRLLAQPELTHHAVTVLGRALVARGAAEVPVGFCAVIAATGAQDVALVVDADGPRVEPSSSRLEPVLVGDAAARLLFLWGRKPGDPRRIGACSDIEVLGTLRSLLAGY